MGSIKSDRENTTVNDFRLSEVRQLVTRLKALNQLERVEYFKSISNNDLEIITELLINVIKGNVPIPAKVFKILKRVRKYIYVLISNKISNQRKKRILYSLKGLKIISLIVPIVLNLLT